MADNFNGLSRLDRRRFLAALLALPAAAALPAAMRETKPFDLGNLTWDAPSGISDGMADIVYFDGVALTPEHFIRYKDHGFELVAPPL